MAIFPYAIWPHPGQYQRKCCGSLQALDSTASTPLKEAWTSLPTEVMRKKREDLVVMLLCSCRVRASQNLIS
ncbi:hypothetical protein N7535_000569 [Penicillium sp. DV-2018c]|nr:hypothetical protein N7461_006183 [Penicillium sp. DV-2018c]KAJ5581949.1 hypothetical protein N7535_000569 [Penicillium sp. DV-2018c]